MEVMQTTAGSRADPEQVRKPQTFEPKPLPRLSYSSTFVHIYIYIYTYVYICIYVYMFLYPLLFIIVLYYATMYHSNILPLLLDLTSTL